MQLVFHTGAHFTEGERLTKCLLRNKEAFSEKGVSVPGPGKYRKLLRQTISAMSENSPASGARDVLLDAILDGEMTERVLMSNANFFGGPKAAIRKGTLYPDASEHIAHLAHIFREDELELFMAVRNPATFVPACFAKSSKSDLTDFMRGTDPRDLRWSDTFVRIRQAAPEIPITVWCNEDAPLLWSQVIREMGGLEHGEAVIGGFDLISDIISEEGMTRLQAYLKSKPEMSEIQIKRVLVAFLDKFALDEAIDEEIDLPGWTNELIDELSEVYDDDVLALGRIPGVTLLSP